MSPKKSIFSHFLVLNIFLIKKVFQGMLNIFYILPEIKLTFCSGSRVDLNPLIEDMSHKKSSFFMAPSLNAIYIAVNQEISFQQ